MDQEKKRFLENQKAQAQALKAEAKKEVELIHNKIKEVESRMGTMENDEKKKIKARRDTLLNQQQKIRNLKSKLSMRTFILSLLLSWLP